MLDICTSSVLFLTEGASDLSSPVTSLHVNASLDANGLVQSPKNSQSEVLSDPEKEIMFVMTRNADITVRDSISGTLVSSLPVHPKKDSIAVSMYIIGKCLQ